MHFLLVGNHLLLKFREGGLDFLVGHLLLGVGQAVAHTAGENVGIDVNGFFVDAFAEVEADGVADLIFLGLQVQRSGITLGFRGTGLAGGCFLRLRRRGGLSVRSGRL